MKYIICIISLILLSGCGVHPTLTRCHYCHEDRDPTYESTKTEPMAEKGLFIERHRCEWTRILREVKTTEWEELK